MPSGQPGGGLELLRQGLEYLAGGEVAATRHLRTRIQSCNLPQLGDDVFRVLMLHFLMLDLLVAIKKIWGIFSQVFEPI